MSRHYHVFQICVFLLVTTACASSDPASPSPAPTKGTATLSWDASEGSNLAGHKIYQATAPGTYGAPIATVPMNVTNYTVTGLESGTTYFFTVTVYKSNGAESSFSNEVSKTIP
jgi:fibronectin type 3 domain-containing protein